jgi:hypothetical protein
MAFQSTVAFLQGAGVPGEIYLDDPHRAQSYILQSASSALNIIGATVFTVVSQGIARAGGTGAFAGFLVDPKEYALYGAGGIPLNPSLTLPNNSQADILSMGTIFVTLPAAAAIGDVVIYDNTTGAISTITPGTAVPVGSSYANATVRVATVAGAGLAIITVDPAVIDV